MTKPEDTHSGEMIGKTLDHYRILEKIGEGGQGSVYKAVDNKLGRTVAVKVLPPEAVTQKNLRYFEREARLASALDHPNICTILDLGEIDGLYFIAMQYVEGKNVRQLVNRRPLELKSALLIGIQVADALAVAHERGIIHRDIKSGNVMVMPSGQVKVLDFGLAKLLDNEGVAGAGIHQSELTEMGVPYGTPAYAAPEQSRGERVDARADIFSTGVVLYEMLTGAWPFQGGSKFDTRLAVMHDHAVRLAEARPGQTPARLQRILDRALAKDPFDRYQKISELRDELREVMEELSSGMRFEVATVPSHHQSATSRMGRALRWLKGLTGEKTAQQRGSTSEGLVYRTPAPTLAEPERKSVAILPFKNLSNDPQSSFYEFSLADAVTTELGRVRSLVVRPSSAILKYQGRDPSEAGRELNVDAILSSAFLRAGERFRVTSQLLDVRGGQLLWSDRIEADANDIIGVQDAIVRQIVDGLRLELSPDEQVNIAKSATQDALAYEEYLRGRDSLGRFIYHTVAREDVDAGIEHFQRTIEVDPNFALAYSALGSSYVNRVRQNLGEAGDYDRAEAAFEKALALDPELLEARMYMVFTYLARNEKRKARDEVEQLIREYPNDVGVHFVRGVLARLDGEYDRALQSFDRMVRLNPAERVVASYNRARIFMYQRRWEDALSELDQGAALEPDHPLIKTFRARVFFYRGELDAARRLLEEVLKSHPKMNGIRPILAICLAAQGHRADALAELTHGVKEAAGHDHDIAYWLASAYAVLGEKNEALQWLATSIDLGNENYRWFESDPNWISLQDDPRFKELMSRSSSSKE